MRGGRRRVLAIGLLLVVLTACRGEKADLSGPPETVGTEPPRTTTTDPYAVPAVIDVAYVNRVLAGLDAVIGDVARLVTATRTIPPEAIERFKSVYGLGDSLQASIDLLQDDMRNGFSRYTDRPGDPRTTVSRLITVQRDCIFASASRDYSLVVKPEFRQSPSAVWVALRPLDPKVDPAGYNRTSWYLAYDGYRPGRLEPDNPCLKP